MSAILGRTRTIVSPAHDRDLARRIARWKRRRRLVALLELALPWAAAVAVSALLWWLS